MEISDIIALGSLSFAVLMGYFTIRKDTKKDDQEETSIMVSLKVDLKYMTKQIESIENKLNRIEEKVDDTNNRISKNEERTNSALKQIDILRDRIGALEHEKTNRGN